MQTPHQFGHVPRHQAFEGLAETRQIRVVTGVHFGDAANHSGPVATGDGAALGRLGHVSQPHRTQCPGVVGDARTGAALLGRAQVGQGRGHLGLGETVDAGQGLAPPGAELQLLGAGVLVMGLLADLAGVHQLAHQAADAGFLQAQQGHQVTGGQGIALADLQQCVHRRGRVVGGGQGGLHEAQLADHLPGGLAQ